MRPTGSPEVLQIRRERAIGLLKAGHQPVEVARMLGVDRRSVRRWKAAYREEGKAALHSKPAPGRPSNLDNKDKAQLERQLVQGARAVGFTTDRWTCPRVAQMIESHFGVRYHVDHIGRLLRSLGWTPQKPTRRAIERNEGEIQRWVKEEWPQVKKRHTLKGLSGFPR